MFFKKKDHRKKGSGVSSFFRLVLSIIVLVLLAIGSYQAYRSFSGIDPLKLDPNAIITGLISSESTGEFIKGLLAADPKKSLEQAKNILKDDQKNDSANPSSPDNLSTEVVSNSPIVYKFAIVADSHKDTDNLAKALAQAKSLDAQFIIMIGDLSDVGTIKELQATKLQLDVAGLAYYTLPGDRDMWDSRDKKLPAETNYTKVFGTPYRAFSFKNTRFIMIFNTDNYLGLDDLQLKWIDDELDHLAKEEPKLTLVILGTPLYHPSSDHVMGKQNPKLKSQADHLISIFNKYGIAEVFAGDTHFFTRYKEPTNLSMTTVGAVTSDRNPQNPRFALVEVREDGSYSVRETEIE